MQKQSSCAAIPMMQPPYLRNRNHPSAFRWLSIACDWRVSVQGQMCSRFVIVFQVAGNDPPKVTLVENDDVLEALATNRADESLDVRRLPWRPIGDHDLFDAHVLDPFLKELTVDRIAIADQEPWRPILGKRFDDLLSCPLGGRVLADIEVDDASPMMTKNDEGEEYPECSRRNSEEIDGDDVGQVIIKECPPSL
jgi:hypothetical protein